METAIDALLDSIDKDKGVIVERLRKRVSKDYEARNGEGGQGSKGLLWVLRNGAKVIDLGHVCPGKLGIITEDDFYIVDPKKAIRSKVQKVMYIGEYPRFYLFSGAPQYYDAAYKNYLKRIGIQPYPDTYDTTDGNLIFLRRNVNSSKVRGVKYTYYLNIEVVDDDTTYDRDTFLIKCHVHNMSDVTYLMDIIEKDRLHKVLRGNKYLAKTWDLSEFTYRSGTYVLRPQSVESCSGKDVYFVNSREQFDRAVEHYKKRSEDVCKRNFRLETNRKYEVIVSEYIPDIILWRGRKMHLRLYGMMTSETTTFKISRFGKILTAALPYKLGDYDNHGIHDTHLKSTPQDLFYPQDFERTDLINMIDDQLDELEIILAKLGQARPYKGQAKKSSMFFGLDILVRTNGELILMEVNHKVGMSTKLQGTSESIAFGIRVDDWKWEQTKHLFDQRTQ